MKKLVVVLMVVLSILFSTVTANAAADPNVMLVNPAPLSTVYSNNLLISVKLTQPKKIKVTVFEEKQIVNGTPTAVNINTLIISNGSVNSANLKPSLIGIPAEFASTNNLSFYTQQINGLTPGLYRIKIDTIDAASSAVLYSSNSYFAVQEKTEEADTKIFETPQSGTMQFLQNLLKTIFGD
ncbi:hypothetical protein FRZ06_16260 [Anoxybacterium hadale]|uniref:Uncharacterized protein n=1 Tax=Anoxybacterium hadale TaxID=3408580 RepID=A0ACD1AEU0_9FIRM|nr:hypothetical protein FRZ06_16260 [Clostridiales bacterium]